MFAKVLIVTIAGVVLGLAVMMGQSILAADPSENTAVDANGFNQFQLLVKSKTPDNLEAAGIQTFVDGVTDYVYGYSQLAIAMTERVATTVPGLTPPSAPILALINQLVVGTALPRRCTTS